MMVCRYQRIVYVFCGKVVPTPRPEASRLRVRRPTDKEPQAAFRGRATFVCMTCVGAQDAGSRLQDHLGPLVLVVVEISVPVWPLFKRQAVADQEGGVDLAPLDALQQIPSIALDMGLSRPDL